MRKILTILLLLAACTTVQAQANRHQLRKAGRDYDRQRYEEAETGYRRALQHDSTDYRGQYNLGNTLNSMPNNVHTLCTTRATAS